MGAFRFFSDIIFTLFTKKGVKTDGEMNADQRKMVIQFLMDDVRGYSDAPPQLIRSEDSSTGFSSVYERRGKFCASAYVFSFMFI